MAATVDFDSPKRTGDSVNRDVAASTEIFAGTIAAINAAGNAVPAADTAGLKVDGFASAHVDNSDGDAGDLNIDVERGIRRVNNSSTNAVTVAEINKVVYVEDDQTVNKDGGTNHIAAGICVDLDDDGVWVDTRLAPTAI
ncbi:MAG: hypothetical protein HZA88_00555 [Verrucomicrobia bacterium]|nr:hypothetical protein [Verrucomicrobiota bacterium]